MDIADAFFDAITTLVDLDDPRESALAQTFLIEALYWVTNDLPNAAREAAAVANRFSTGAVGEKGLETERVKLWESIAGREGSNDADVLRTRAAICVLYPTEAADMHDTVATFLDFWFRGSLSETHIASALENQFGLRS